MPLPLVVQTSVEALLANCTDALPVPQNANNNNFDSELLFTEQDSQRFVSYVGWSITVTPARTRDAIAAAVRLPPRVRRNGRFVADDDADDEDGDGDNDDDDENSDDDSKDRRIAKMVRVFFKQTSIQVSQRGFESYVCFLSVVCL